MVKANPTVASKTTKVPVVRLLKPGLMMIKAARKSANIATTRDRFSFSPRNKLASNAAQIGVVNSMAMTSASGSNVTPTAQQY
jgi:hypothetical protein